MKTIQFILLFFLLHITVSGWSQVTVSGSSGLDGNYASLTRAGGVFAALNAAGSQAGRNIEVLITADINNEDGSNALNNKDWTLLTIKPNAPGRVVSSSATGLVLKIKCSNLVIDGSSNGSSSQDLTLMNPSAGSAKLIYIGSTGAVPLINISVKNCLIVNSGGAVMMCDATTLYNAGRFNTIAIVHNDIQKGMDPIFCAGTNSSGLNISNNTMNASGANANLHQGIYVAGFDGVLISGNDIGNLNGYYGIEDAGIRLRGVINTVVEKNNIHDISYTGMVYSGAKGIYLNLGPNANVSIRNNMISGMKGDGDAYWSFGAYFSPVGIYLQVADLGPALMSGIDISYNTIYLSGATLNNPDVYSFGIAKEGYSPIWVNVKNNIIYNQLGPAGSAGTGAVGIAGFINGDGSEVDYNDYYCDAASGTNSIGKFGDNDYTTLAAWQAASGLDLHSRNIRPVFVSATDLHLLPSNCGLDGYGTALPGITTDYDQEIRDPLSPDMGADEFTAVHNVTLAGMPGSSVSDEKQIAPGGTTYVSSGCDLIATVLPSGTSPVSGMAKATVSIDATQLYYNTEPYVQRHFDIEPAGANTTTTSATITLYFHDSEFVNFNTKNPTWPPLPTVAGGGNADPNRANLKITQYHGLPTTSPSAPGNYTGNGGAGVYINPPDGNIVWNGAYWAVTVDITGFSGFYVHTNAQYPLAIDINYLQGTRQDNHHLLNWKVTCNSSPSVKMELQRSATVSGPFVAINTISATALECQQPFAYADNWPLPGMNYYRLKLTDAAGKISYSTVVALLNAEKGVEMVNLVPNPVQLDGHFSLNISSARASRIELVVTDMTGRVVQRRQAALVAGYNSIPMNVATLAPGVYQLTGITSDDKTRTIRFIIQ